MSRMQHDDPRLRQGYSRARGGTREDLGIYVRSAWEANVARYLSWLQGQGEIHEWAYEADTFWFEHIKRGVRSYTPDFRIRDTPDGSPYYWEVKGYQHQRGQTALARMARFYPGVKVVVIGESEYTALAKWKGLIPGWE